mgnify:CR=1 FL=1
MKEELIKEIQNIIYDSEHLSEEQKEKYFKFFELLKSYPGDGIIVLLERVKEGLTSEDERKFKSVFEEIEKKLSLIEEGKSDQIVSSLGL